MVFPHGNGAQSLGVYLDAGDNEKDKNIYSWFKLAIVHQTEPQQNKDNGTHSGLAGWHRSDLSASTALRQCHLLQNVHSCWSYSCRLTRCKCTP